MMRKGRKYKGCFLRPTAEGWETWCFGVYLADATLAGIKQFVTENYPACLRHGRARHY